MPIGCDESGAVEYLGCTKGMFQALRVQGYFRPVRRNWYLYRVLDEGVERLIREMGTMHHASTQDEIEGSMANQSHRRRRKTADLLREIRGGSGKQSA